MKESEREDLSSCISSGWRSFVCFLGFSDDMYLLRFDMLDRLARGKPGRAPSGGRPVTVAGGGARMLFPSTLLLPLLLLLLALGMASPTLAYASTSEFLSAHRKGCLFAPCRRVGSGKRRGTHLVGRAF